jgi:hypothetical protein
MSENYENNRTRVGLEGKTLDVNVVVDRSFELEEKQREIDELKQTLTQIASKELNARCEKYGISKDLSDDAKISKIKDAELSRSNTALLNDNQTRDYSNSGNNEVSFNSENEAVLALQKAKKSGNTYSAQIEAKLARKFLEKPVNLEFEGKLADLARKPLKSASETPEQFEQRVNDAKLKQKWRNLNSVSDME